MISAQPTPELKLGLIGYRDRGDEYVVKSFSLTDDIDAIYAHLREFQANGGGDTPESVNEALAEAIHKMPWSSDKKVLKIIFLVGDAPPHMDYSNGPKYPDLCREAAKKDLIVVGDRVLVKIVEGEERTNVGLYLPPTAVDNQAVQSGTIVATGPGLPLPAPDTNAEEPWRTTTRETRFVPMQAQIGDYALFFRKAAVEITFEGDRFLVVPQAAILALVRDDDFDIGSL